MICIMVNRNMMGTVKHRALSEGYMDISRRGSMKVKGDDPIMKIERGSTAWEAVRQDCQGRDKSLKVVFMPVLVPLSHE